MFRDFILEIEKEINVKVLTVYLLSLFCVAACGKPPSIVDPTLIGGKPADPKDWPSSVYASMSGSRCSATVIGERALLIASHCVRNGGEATFTVGANSYKSICTRHPEYPKNSTADWTLCLIDKPVVGGPFEVVNMDAARVKLGVKLTLSGYGCIQSGGGGGNDGIFRIGEAPVTGTPSGQDYDIVTKGSAALCFGDSGGAAYTVLGPSRWIVGVNSRGDISTTSYLPAVHLAAKFFQDWSKANGVAICGVDSAAKNCRALAPEPELPTDFVVTGRAGKCVGKVNPGFESVLQELSNRIKAVLDSVNY